MNPKTLTALRGSIAKWQAIVNGTAFNGGPANCPLCQEFLYTYDGNMTWRRTRITECIGCPVFERTGLQYCDNTPYNDYEQGEDKGFDAERLKELAQAELDFLKSLLPKRT